MIAIEGASDLTALGLAIRQRRIDLGWSQAQLAERAGVSQGALSMFERAGCGLQIDRLAAVLKQVGLILVVDEGSAYAQQESA